MQLKATEQFTDINCSVKSNLTYDSHKTPDTHLE